MLLLDDEPLLITCACGYQMRRWRKARREKFRLFARHGRTRGEFPVAGVPDHDTGLRRWGRALLSRLLEAARRVPICLNGSGFVWCFESRSDRRRALECGLWRKFVRSIDPVARPMRNQSATTRWRQVSKGGAPGSCQAGRAAITSSSRRASRAAGGLEGLVIGISVHSAASRSAPRRR